MLIPNKIILQNHVQRESGWTPALVVRTVRLITGVELITRQIHAPPVLKAKEWVLDWENKKVTAHGVSISYWPTG